MSPSSQQSVPPNLDAGLAVLAPECLLASAVMLRLVLRILGLSGRVGAGISILPCAVVALVWMSVESPLGVGISWGNLIRMDDTAVFLRTILLVYLIIALILNGFTLRAEPDDNNDFTTMQVGGIIGMMIMVSANHLMMAFIGLEMASLPAYALAGFHRQMRIGAESSLKYVVYGSAASAVALFGISLIYIALGAGTWSGISSALHSNPDHASLAYAGLLLFCVGLGFKLAAVPFHFWCPDVFAGAPAEVGGFLSVASKTAAVGLALRVVVCVNNGLKEFAANAIFTGGLLLIAALTITLGNLAALAQRELKRLLAYSTIAHAGMMLLATGLGTEEGYAAAEMYLAAYLPANLGAFGFLAVLRNRSAGGDETIDACRGLLRRSPVLGVTAILFFMSLLGLPPLAGFWAKFQVFTACKNCTPLLIVAMMNIVIGAVYYLRIVRAIVLDEPSEGADTHQQTGPAIVMLVVLAAAVVLLGLFWMNVYEYSSAIRH